MNASLQPLRWPWIVAYAIPTTLTAAFCLAGQREVGSLLAPVFGPWAGLLIGHSDCTMANAMPAVTWTCVAIGAVLLVSLIRFRQRPFQIVGRILGWFWTVTWCGLAVLSILNSLS